MRLDHSGNKRWVFDCALFLGCVVALSLSPMGQSFARPRAVLEEARFDVASQPLTSALIAYARIAKIEILVDDGLVVGRQSAALNGTLHPTIALRQLLAQTDLEIRYVDRGTVTLVPQRPLGSSPDHLDDQYLPFTAALQAAFAQTICSDNSLGLVRVAAQLWIGSSGAVVRALLLDSTGDGDRDAAIVERLEALRIGSAPPTSLPHPATVIFAPRNAADCSGRVGRLP